MVGISRQIIPRSWALYSCLPLRYRTAIWWASQYGRSSFWHLALLHTVKKAPGGPLGSAWSSFEISRVRVGALRGVYTGHDFFTGELCGAAMNRSLGSTLLGDGQNLSWFLSLSYFLPSTALVRHWLGIDSMHLVSWVAHPDVIWDPLCSMSFFSICCTLHRQFLCQF